jgi:hypothetical protein
MLVGVSLSGQVVRLVARRHVVPGDVLVARRHVDREDVLGARLAFAVIDHSALRPAASQSRRRGKGVAMAIIRTKGERINVGLGIHLLLLGQSRRDKRQGGVEACSKRRFLGIFERGQVRGGQVEDRGHVERRRNQVERRLGGPETSRCS